MLRNLIIIGNSGASIETYTLFQDMLYTPVMRTIYKFKGFLSHKGYKGSLGDLSHLELGSDEDYIPQSNDVFALGIGDTKIRFKAFTQMKDKGGEFINLISPWAFIAKTAKIGEGNNICIGCHISDNVEIGNANYLNGNVRFGHDVSIGNGNFFGNQSMLMGNVKLGNFNSIAPASILMEKCKVGNNNKIAPAAVVYKGCRDNCLMAGNPALKITELNL